MSGLVGTVCNNMKSQEKNAAVCHTNNFSETIRILISQNFFGKLV